jgi:hypothetical protein
MTWFTVFLSLSICLGTIFAVWFYFDKKHSKWDRIISKDERKFDWFSIVESSKHGAVMIIAALPKQHDIQFYTPMSWYIDKPFDKPNFYSQHERQIRHWWQRQHITKAPFSAGVTVARLGHYPGALMGIVLRAKESDMLHGSEWQWIDWLEELEAVPSTPKDEISEDYDIRERFSQWGIPLSIGFLFGLVTCVLNLNDVVRWSILPTLQTTMVLFGVGALVSLGYIMFFHGRSIFIRTLLAQSLLCIALPFGAISALFAQGYLDSTATEICAGTYEAYAKQRGKTKNASISLAACEKLDDGEKSLRTNISRSMYNEIQSTGRIGLRIYQDALGNYFGVYVPNE